MNDHDLQRRVEIARWLRGAWIWSTYCEEAANGVVAGKIDLDVRCVGDGGGHGEMVWQWRHLIGWGMTSV